jgi:hypothetical protein
MNYYCEGTPRWISRIFFSCLYWSLSFGVWSMWRVRSYGGLLGAMMLNRSECAASASRPQISRELMMMSSPAGQAASLDCPSRGRLWRPHKHRTLI